MPLLTGQMTFRNFIPPALANRDPFSDPYALMWEGRYVECLVSRLKARKAIVAWESGNESCVLSESRGAASSEFWLRYIHQTIRCADPSRPVIGVNGLCVPEESDWPSSMNGRLSDLVATHPYGFWGDAWKIWAKACPVRRILATGEKDIFVSEHFLDDGHVALLVVNNGGSTYHGAPALRDGWRVTGAMTDDHESAKWADGTLTLAPCAGIVLMVR